MHLLVCLLVLVCVAHAQIDPKAFTPVELPSTGDVTVSTKSGPVVGQKFNLKDGKEVQAFRGIRFAKPPVGPLRFAKPQPPDPWDSPVDAKKFTPTCFQPSDYYEMQEDCLFLNVFGPTGKTGLPVLFWIHGGNLEELSADFWGIWGILNSFASRDVVVVTINYRLGVFGFFSTGTDEAKGNWGFWDQNLALKWAKDNIANFGGDPEQITLFGESSGSVSVGAQMESPQSYDLFKQAILMSTTHFCGWTHHSLEKVNKTSSDLFEHFKCTNVDCLRKVDAKELLAYYREYQEDGRDSVVIAFDPYFARPVIDNEFITGPFLEMAKKSPKKPLIVGIVSAEEGIDYERFGFPRATVNSKYIDHYVDVVLTWMDNKPDEVDTIKKLIKQDYFNYDYVHDQRRAKNDIVKFVGDQTMNYCTYRVGQVKADMGAPVWLYEYDWVPPEARKTEIAGAFHASEMAYLFNYPSLIHFTVSPSDEKTEWNTQDDVDVVNHFANLWSNFAKHGNPTPEPLDGFTWAPISKEKPGQYLRIKPCLKLLPEFRPTMRKFNYETIPKALGRQL